MILKTHIKILKMVRHIYFDIINVSFLLIAVFNELKWMYVILKQKKTCENHRKSWKRGKILQTTIAKLKSYLVDEDSIENELPEGKNSKYYLQIIEIFS